MHPRLRRACLGIFLALMLLAAIPACGVRQLARGEIQPPKVTFQGLKIYQPTPRGWPLGARLLLENPNSQAVNLLGYDYQLWIEGKSVAQGISQQAVNLPPSGADGGRGPHHGAIAHGLGALAPVPPHAAKVAAATPVSLSDRRQLPPRFRHGRYYPHPLQIPGGGLPQRRHGLSPPLPQVSRERQSTPVIT